jgi:molybdopterin-guanine dinucleotide biosynthesis protein MobB
MNMNSYDQCPTPLLGFCAFSGTGKTTLLENLIPYLKEQKLRLAVIKHAHHNFDVDQPAKDSYKLRHAGACEMLISSGRRWALMHELQDSEKEYSLLQLLEKIDHENIDLILVEGFKKEPIQKIELHRPSLGHNLLCIDDENVIAVATDETLPDLVKQPVLDLNKPELVGEFILQFFNLR